MTGIIGHRGGRNLWPENGLTGFRNLLDLPVAGVEFDLHLSDSGEVLVIHDARLDRTVEATGLTRSLSPERRKVTRLKDSADTVPLLSEVLEVYADSPLALHIELKNDELNQPYPGLPALALAEIDRLGLRDRAVLTSFDLGVLETCRDLAPDVRRLCSMSEGSTRARGFEASLAATEPLADYIAIHKDLLDTHWTEVSRRIAPERLCAWVCNTEGELHHWLARAPGFITSDDPALACRLAAETPAPA
ncbi:glycerophosphodiester phosphodiesterase family protein [Pseudooceanicola sp. 200-1SW]|uniref:glycerophosphodiester phosphodiesterase family protein n=1 Tax=Pseudooceanicola sp. 200-1SW TaxID=3425949 RepID=UPI003D7F2037